MGVDHFQDLIVWQLADELRREIVEFTDTGPASKDFRFRNQIREAIASACRNTSEGFDRFRPAVFAYHLEIAHGSLGEVQDCLLDAQNRRYIDSERFKSMWRLSRRAIGSNVNLATYLKDCAAKGREPWRRTQNDESSRPRGEPTTRARRPEVEKRQKGEEPEPKNPEPKNPEPKNPEPKNPEPENREL